MRSATQILAFQEWKLKFIKIFYDKPLLISAGRSLLSYCTVLASEAAKDMRKLSFKINLLCQKSFCVFFPFKNSGLKFHWYFPFENFNF